MDLRDRLGELLVAAAELEHGVVCQYLFAAFSMKRRRDEGVSWEQLELMRRWEADLLLISRQEMEHLGLVANLLTAIGEAPHFLRPPFPIPSEFYPVHDPPNLERFGPEFLRRLIRLEQPAKQTSEHEEIASSLALDLDAETAKSVGQLYEEIADIFRQLDGPDLFIGPPSAQRVTLEIVPVPLRGVTLPPNTTLYDVTFNAVTDLKSALAVITQIVEEGEGSPKGRATSHYGRLLEIARDLKAATERDPSFEPARPVMENPTREKITDPAARRIFDLCDDAYAITVLLLMRYFGQSDETAPEVAALQQAVFFPLMTAVIRPLGEVLTQLPAVDDPGVRAGPSFTLPRRLAFLPHRQAAWSLIEQHLDGMAADAERLSTDSTYPAPLRSRLEFAYQNLARIAYNFRTAMQEAPPGP
ncbi:MAG: ferritin-like protein [Chloroflexi bacterium]|nr:ferritin-like protein [Chloroflexota bacterium]